MKIGHQIQEHRGPCLPTGGRVGLGENPIRVDSERIRGEELDIIAVHVKGVLLLKMRIWQ